MAEIRELMMSGGVSEEVRERVVARLESGLTVRQAADALAYLRRLAEGSPEPARAGQAA